MSDGNVSAQNNVTTAAEYQAAADEITAIINAQRAERAPIEAEQVLLQNRAELLFERQQQALNTLRAAEADPGDPAFLEQSRLAYNRATSEVNTVNTAIQQNRSVLAQSRQSTAILQDQRSTLEVLAEFAEQGPPNQNSLPPPATTTPGQAATFVPTPPTPIPPTVAPASQPTTVTVTATASAQNNVTTAAEYQQAADEITEIINVQRAERAPLEAELDQLRVRADTQAQRQQAALDALRDAEDIGDPAAIATATTAYQRATNDLVVTSQAQQQIRSSLAQSRQSTAELQEQRGRLETNADLAANGLPTLNSLPPPATIVPDQSATYVAPPPAPVLTQLQPDPQPEEDIPSLAPAGQNNVSIAEQWDETTFEISSAQRTIRAENFAASENILNLNQQLAQASQARQLARDNLDRAVAAGASDAEIAALDAQRQAALNTAVQLEQQIEREQSVIASNQETLNLLEQQRLIADEAALAARSGPPGLNSVPPPATVVADQDPAAYDLPPTTYADSFRAGTVSADGDEALVAFEQAQLAQQEGRAFEQVPDVPASGDEALVAFEQAQLARNEAAAFGAADVNDPYFGLSPQQIAALGGADPTDPYIRARLGIPQLPGPPLAATPGFGTIKSGVPLIDNALNFLGGLFGRPATPPTPAAAEVTAASDAELQAIQDAEAQQLAEQEGLAFPPVESPAPVGDEALQAIEDAEAAELAAAEGSAFAAPPPVNPELDEQLAQSTQGIEDAAAAELAAQEGSAFAPPVDAGSDAELQAIEDAQAADLAAQEGTAFAAPVPTEGDEALAAAERARAEQEGGNVANPDAEELAAEAAARQKAKEQAVLQARYKQPSTPDWRVRLVLAEGSTYLYNAPEAGILAPLARSNGVIFPYTPQITTSYQANYDQYDLIHSNFRGVFYKNSKVNDIQIRCTFTAQDSSEAAYVLAVIHFFRSVTKMFYGTDQERGTPPPLVYLVGYGDYQFAGHPCLVSTFNYTLPNDVDYIRANAFNNYGQNLLARREAPLSAPSPSAGQQARQAILSSVGINPGAVPRQLTPSTVTQNVNNTERATYVPTKMEIDISLIPVNTRNQISKGFSFKEFANGNLVKKGYW